MAKVKAQRRRSGALMFALAVALVLVAAAVLAPGVLVRLVVDLWLSVMSVVTSLLGAIFGHS